MAIKLTFRQKVLLELLKYQHNSKQDIFTKRTFVPTIFNKKMWKYTNSLVYGNAIWFGGRTTRKKTVERGKVHHKELGFDNQMKIIEHASPNHRLYRINVEQIKRYLLATISKKVVFSKIDTVVSNIEQEYEVELRNVIWKIGS